MGSALGIDTATVAPLADADVALWAIMAAFLWRFAGFTMVVYLAGDPRRSRASTTSTPSSRVPAGSSAFRRITWPLLWPQTFALVLLTTLGTLRIFDMVWIMTAGGPSHATETVATDVYVTAFRFLEVGYAQAMAMILLAVILLLADRRVPDPQPARRDGELVTGVPRVRWSTVLLSVLALVWLYPVVWTLTNAVKSSADIYRAPWDVPWPPAIGNIGEAWSRGQLGLAMANSAYVTAMTVAVVLALSVSGSVRAHAAATARPGRAVPRGPGAVDHPDGGADRPVVLDVPRPRPDQQPARARADQRRGKRLVRDGDPRRLLPDDPAGPHRCRPSRRSRPSRGPVRIVVPLARPGIVAVAILVAVFTWNDFGGALVLIQRPDAFTVQLALTRFSTFYATDQGLTFAGMAIVILPPLLLFLVLQRSFIQGLTAGVVRR